MKAPLSELAPSGKLRVGINHSNFLLVNRDSAFGAPKGVAPDLAIELAKRAGIELQWASFDAAGKLADAVKDALVDVGFIGNEPQRAEVIAFSPPYLELPVTYLVPAGSSIRSLEDVDREGIRVSVSGRSAYDLYLTRFLKKAQLVRSEGIPASVQTFVDQKLEALAGLKPGLMEELKKIPGARILDGQVTAVQQSVGVPKARSAAARYIRDFVEAIKAEGIVARAVERHGVKGVSVAPKA